MVLVPTMRRPGSMAGLHGRPSSMAGSALMGASVGFTRMSSNPGSPRLPTRSSWRQSTDEVGDIAAAMAAVELAMKSKSKAREAEDLKLSLEEAGRQIAEETERRMHELAEQEARNAEERARREFEQERAVAKLRGAMKKCNLKALKKAIDHALELQVQDRIVNEAGALWRLENQLRTAVAAADLSEIRKAVDEVERGLQLAHLPQEPPFAYQQRLQYWSGRREAWIDCYVTEVSPDDGRILISLKKKAGHWFSLHEQHERFRVDKSNIAAAAPYVRLHDARLLLDNAEMLEVALRSEDVDRIRDAIIEAGAAKALQPLIASAERFVGRVLKDRAELEAARRSDEAAAWHAAKKSIQVALQAEADRAYSEASGKGWGTLESGLVVERLDALERCFDSSDLNSLESSIEQLGSEEFEVPVEVIAQAKEALAGIKKKHLELDFAIGMGDVHGINAALDLAIEHMLPKGLVTKAESVREAVDLLTKAMASRDPDFLKSAWSKVQKDFPYIPHVERACSIILATLELQEALESGAIDAVVAALKLVDNQYLPEQLLTRAEAAQKLASAVDLQDAQAIEEALRAARARGVPESMLAKAQQEFEAVMHSKRRASLQTFELALQGNDFALRRQSLQRARECGVPQEQLDVLLELDRKKALDDVQDALRSSDYTSVKEALRRAEQCGVAADVLARLIKEEQMRLTAEVKAAMEGDDFDLIDQALQRAQGRGLPSELLADFQKQRSAKRLERIFQGNDFVAKEQALHEAKGHGVSKEILLHFSEQLEDERSEKEKQQRLEEALREAERRRTDFRVRMESMPEGSVMAIRALIREGEELLMEAELHMLKEKLDAELRRRMEKAKVERAENEKLAAEFKNAKEAQDFGGGVLVAQWRAAVAEIAKPLVINEDD